MGSEWQNVSSKLKRRAHPENMKLHSFIHSLGFKVFSLLYFFYLLGGAGLALFAIYWQWHFKFKHNQMVLNGFSPEKNFFAFSFPE